MLNALSEDEQERIFQFIKDQFQNADISCRIVTKLLNWHVEVIAIVVVGDEKRRRYAVTRQTWELFQQPDEEITAAIENVVYVLRHAMGHEVFANPNAPLRLEYKSTDKEQV